MLRLAIILSINGFGNFGKSIYFERQKPLKWYNVHKPTTLKGQ